MQGIFRVSLLATLFALIFGIGTAHALPAFARKYKTACTTCHIIFPKLNPFGEQFRRNGYRFPGVDSDSVKAEPIAIGTDEQKKAFPDAVWPSMLTPFPPLAFGFNGQAVFHPDRKASAAENNTTVNLDGLIEEGHLWAAGSIDDSITFYSELTAADGGLELETAAVFFNDLVGPAHAVNLAVGKRIGSYTTFQNHGSFLADAMVPSVGVSGLYGNGDPFIFNDNHNGIEVNGVLASQLSYSVGFAAGKNLDTRNSANFYGHVGYKLGGANLDGENVGGVPQDLAHENAVTIDAFAYRAVSRFDDGSAAPAAMIVKDTTLTLGAALRAQLAELELDAGVFYQTDDHVTSMATKVATISQWNELSYLIFPWLAAAARVEFLRVAQDGMPAVSDLKLTPGLVALIRSNIKLTLTAPIERANGMPDAGWSAAGLDAAPADMASKVGPEVESVQLQLWAAF